MAMNSMSSITQMNSMGLNNLGTGSSMSNYYSINNMAASLLAQSKFCAHKHITYIHITHYTDIQKQFFTLSQL